MEQECSTVQILFQILNNIVTVVSCLNKMISRKVSFDLINITTAFPFVIFNSIYIVETRKVNFQSVQGKGDSRTFR